MKTLKKKNKGKQEYKRVFDTVADHMVKNQGWAYCPKGEWKEKVRDIENPKSNTTPTKNKNNEMSRAAKRHLRKTNSAK